MAASPSSGWNWVGNGTTISGLGEGWGGWGKGHWLEMQNMSSSVLKANCGEMNGQGVVEKRGPI